MAHFLRIDYVAGGGALLRSLGDGLERGQGAGERGVVEESTRERTLAELQRELARWRTFGEQVAAPAYIETYVICDAHERVVQRIDQPRVNAMPTLRYAMPDPAEQNWTLYPGSIAQGAVLVLDEHVPQHAPHRVIHLRELVRERIDAAEQGISLLSGVEPEGDLQAVRPA